MHWSKKNDNGTNNDLQNTSQKTQDRATWTPLKVGVDLMSSGRVNSSFTTKKTCKYKLNVETIEFVLNICQ
jgi:hypothetical protein